MDACRFPQGTRRQYLTTLGYSLSFISIALGFGIVGPSIPIIETLTGQSTSAVGWMLVARGLGDAAGTFSVPLQFAPSCTARRGLTPHLVLTLNLLLLSLCSALNALLVPLTGSFSLVLLFSFILGLTNGLVDAGVNTLVPWLWEPAKLNFYMNLLHFIWGLGAGLSPQFIELTFLITDSPTLWIFYSQLFLAVVQFALSWGLFRLPTPTPEDPTQLLEGGDLLEDREALLEDPSDDLDDPSLHPPSHPSKHQSSTELDRPSQSSIDEDPTGQSSIDAQNIIQSASVMSFDVSDQLCDDPEEAQHKHMRFFIAHRDAIIIYCLSAMLFVYIGVELGFSAWITRYGLDMGMSKELATSLTTVFWWSLTLGRGIFTALAIYLSPSTVLMLDMVLCFAALGCVAFFKSAGMLVFSTGFLGFGCASVFPTVLALPSTIGVNLKRNSTTIIVGGAAIGNLIIPPSIGLVLEHAGPQYLPLAIFITLALSVFVLAVVLVLSKINPKKE